MPSYAKQLQLTGGVASDDVTEHHSHGRFWIEIDQETREVAASFPDRFGVPGQMYTFTPEDWDAIVEAINEAELRRGKIVSTAWEGK